MKTVCFNLLLTITIAANCQPIKIIPHSTIAKIACWLTHSTQYAVTINRTIYISCDKQAFYDRPKWMLHEFVHVWQYQRLGTLEFLKRYAFFSIFKGHHNRFEREAQAISGE
jgi:hypothetical protein